MNWKQVAAKDRRLRQDADNASEALARHRYENTVGAGVSFREYARQCDVHESRVRQYANAYEVRRSAPHLSISDALVRASTSADRFDVIEAIAKGGGTSAKTVQTHHKAEVALVHQAASLRAEERGTTVREEAKAIVAITRRRAKAEESAKERRRSSALGWVELDGHLDKARVALAAAARVEVDLTVEESELIHETIKTVRSLLKLVEARFVGMSDRDFDAEVAELLSKGA